MNSIWDKIHHPFWQQQQHRMRWIKQPSRLWLWCKRLISKNSNALMQALSPDSDAISAGESAPSLDEKWETDDRLGVEESWCALFLLLPQLGSLFHYLVKALRFSCCCYDEG